MAYWFGFAAVAGAFGGLIAFGIQTANLSGSLHEHNWKLLFIVEGLPAFALGVITIFLLPGRPDSTTFFKDGPERDLAVERANRGTAADVGHKITTGILIFSKHGDLCLSIKYLSTYQNGIQGPQDLHRWRHLLRPQLCPCFYLCLPSHYHYCKSHVDLFS